MKKTLKFVSGFLCVSLLLGSTTAFACTGAYVGKDVSADGSTIIARSEDISPSDYDKLHYVVPGVANKKGQVMTDINGIQVALPDTTYQYTTMSDYKTAGDGLYAAVCTNVNGVSVTGTVSASPCKQWKEADPTVKAGLREAILPAYVAATAKTAKEGVTNMLSAVDTYGSAEGNILMVADQNEAWLVELYGGHQYAAMKMPADKVAVFGNQFMIETVDPSDTENYIFSKDLFATIDKLGLAVKENEKYHLAKSICDKTRSDNSNMRTWVGHQVLAPSTAGDYKTETFYPLFYKPDGKVALQDVMGIYRNRFEGTKYDMTVAGNEKMRPIAVSTTPETHIVQLFSDMPAAASSVTWLAMGGGEHSVFLPEFGGISDVAPAYKVDSKTYSPDSLYWAFKSVCGLADTNRTLYKGVGDFYAIEEAQMIKKMAAEQKTVKNLYAADPAKGAAYTTALAKIMAEEQMANAQGLYADLLTVLTHNAGLSATKTPTTFVADTPLRDAAAGKGYAVTWNGADQTITLKKGAASYTLTLGSKTCKTAGEDLKLTHAPYTKNGTTYAPVDFIMGL
ncbi:MAG: C69 family dipeptidase [Oscillospiraceae bacterium]